MTISACITIIRGSKELTWTLLQISENFEKFLPCILARNYAVRDSLEATAGCLNCLQYSTQEVHSEEYPEVAESLTSASRECGPSYSSAFQSYANASH